MVIERLDLLAELMADLFDGFTYRREFIVGKDEKRVVVTIKDVDNGAGLEAAEEVALAGRG